MTVVYVPRDSSAVSLGADAVAEAIHNEAASRERDVKIVRNGSRGMFSHEPMVEVATSAGRIAYGPVGRATSRRCSIPAFSTAARIACVSAWPRKSRG